MFDRFNRFKDHFHNPKTRRPRPKKLISSKSHRHVCPGCVPVAITNSQGTFFYDLRAASPGRRRTEDGGQRPQTHCAIPPPRKKHSHPWQHIDTSTSTWHSGHPHGSGLLIFLIFLWRLLGVECSEWDKSVGWMSGNGCWRVIIFCVILCFSFFFTGNFCHWN